MLRKSIGFHRWSDLLNISLEYGVIYIAYGLFERVKTLNTRDE